MHGSQVCNILKFLFYMYIIDQNLNVTLFEEIRVSCHKFRTNIVTDMLTIVSGFLGQTKTAILYEPRHEKTNILHMRKESADQLRSNCKDDQRLSFRYWDRTIPLLSKPKISSL